MTKLQQMKGPNQEEKYVKENDLINEGRRDCICNGTDLFYHL